MDVLHWTLKGDFKKVIKRKLSYLSLTAVPIMDNLETELMPIGNLNDDCDSSEDNSTKEGRKSKLHFVNPISVGELSWKS